MSDIVHTLRDTSENWKGYQCSFCGARPQTQDEAYDWCPLSGDGWCCIAERCNKDLEGYLREPA